MFLIKIRENLKAEQNNYLEITTTLPGGPKKRFC